MFYPIFTQHAGHHHVEPPAVAEPCFAQAAFFAESRLADHPRRNLVIFPKIRRDTREMQPVESEIEKQARHAKSEPLLPRRRRDEHRQNSVAMKIVYGL